MKKDEATLYLASNMREAISVAEGLRVSVGPLRGLGQLATRPAFSDGLRTSEVLVLAGGIGGEFPILFSIRDTIPSVARDGIQIRCIPLTSVEAIIFRTAEERDHLLGKQFDNVNFEGVRSDIRADLFGHEGEPRFSPREGKPRLPETTAWRKADIIGGCLAAVSAAAEFGPEYRAVATRFSDAGVDLPFSVATVLASVSGQLAGDTDAGGAARAAISLMASRSGSPGFDPEELLEASMNAIRGQGEIDEQQLGRFHDYVSGILNSRTTRRADASGDSGNILLRALGLVILRRNVSDIIGDTAAGSPPGPKVMVIASALAGMLEGLARLPARIKAPQAALLGMATCLIEDESGEYLKQAYDIVRSLGAEREEVSRLSEEPEPLPNALEQLFDHLKDLANESEIIATLDQGGGKFSLMTKKQTTCGKVSLLKAGVRIEVNVSPFKKDKICRSVLKRGGTLGFPAIWLDDEDNLSLVSEINGRSPSDVLAAFSKTAALIGELRRETQGRSSQAKSRTKSEIGARRSATGDTPTLDLEVTAENNSSKATRKVKKSH